MYTLFIVLIFICAIALVGIVLMQRSKGGGLAAGFESANNLAGAPKTTDFLEKATWGLAAAMIIFCILAVGVRKSENGIGDSSAITTGAAATEKAEEQKATEQTAGFEENAETPAAEAPAK